MAVQIQFRRGSAASWVSANTILAEGELGLETDTTYFKIGNGTTAWNSLSYSQYNGTLADINDITNVAITSAASGQVLQWNGTAWVNGTIDLSVKANIASPTFTGTPLAPTANSLANNTQIATTAFVQAAVSGLVDTAPETLNTLNELAAALGDDANFATTTSTALGLKAPLANPTFTGTVTLPNDTVTANAIATGAVTAAKLADNAVTSSAIATGAVTAAKLADNAVTSSAIAAGAVTAAKLADNAVTSNAIAEGAIVNAKMVNSNVVIGSTTVSLGSTETAISGLASIQAANANVSTQLRVTTVVEPMSISGTAATGTVAIDYLSAPSVYYTANAAANWTLNVRGNSSVTMNSIMSVGDVATVTFLSAQGATAYLANAVQVDGSAVTPKWQGGTAPTSGNVNSIDGYTLTVVKTAATPSYTVFASQTKFA